MMTTSRQVGRPRPRSRAQASAAVGQVLQNADKRLREAADGNLSAKALHDLRIACRRAEAALWLCQDAADGRAWRWLMRRLKTLRGACNEARDDDVLCQWIKRHGAAGSQSVRHAIQAHRKTVQPQIAKLAQQSSEGDRFHRRSQKVVKHLRDCELKGRTAQMFGRRLFAEVNRFVKSLPAQRNDVDALHGLRIAGKRLRYASELVTEIWPDVTLTELNEHLHALQDQLGTMRDHIVGARRLQKTFPDRAVEPLVRKAQAAADRLQRSFWRWWQSSPIERMLADTTAEVVTLIRQKP
jgi:triphosphatase